MAFDLVIRNGTIVDGSGLARYRADLGIVDGRIASIGRVAERGAEEIDADGHVVTPGFIDAHAHMDAQVFWDPFGASSCWHGVTSVVMGNCGFTLAPASAGGRALVVQNLERSEDIPAAALAEGIEWTWETFAEYLDAVDARPKGINYAAYVGHSALRTQVMGERAFTEPANDDDLARMEAGLIEALQAGAVGFSSSQSMHHRTTDDRPVASRQASWDEITRLVRAMGRCGGGVFELALEEAARYGDPERRAESLDRLRTLAVSSGATVTFGVFPTATNAWEDHLGTLDTAAAGGRMVGQCTSRAMSSILSFRTRLPFDRLPEWAEVRALPVAEQMIALAQPEVRARLVSAANHGEYRRAVGAEAKPPDYERMRVLGHPLPVPPDPTVAELAAQRGLDPVELMIDLALVSNLEQLFAQTTTPEDDLLTIMRHPRTVMTFSDTGAHVSQMIDASIQTHLLAHWVRQEQALSLEEAVRMVTFALARVWGIRDRGLVCEGMVADLNVFDPERIAPPMPRVVADLPGGGQRLEQRSNGILATIVGGQVVIADGEHTGAFPGRVLRGSLAGSR